MCGILGTVGIPFDSTLLDTIAHRGPDGEGIRRYVCGGRDVCFGHRRLSIVDLSDAGAQPIDTRAGRHSMVYNGEVYNHAELRREMADTRFAGHSDTETVLYYLASRGPAGLARLNGIFALGFLDLERKRLILCRDPFGVKPLYYWHRDGCFAFASELRCLRALARTELDRGNLAELLRLRYSPSPDTLYRDVYKVRPGHFLEVDLGKATLSVRERPFTEAPSVPADAPPYPEAVRTYGEHVEEAVKRQLMSDVEVGVFLSGGVDSALVASLAQKHSGSRLKAFTVGYQEVDEADEIEDARATARTAGLDHHEVRIGYSDFLETLRSIVNVVEEPLATTSVIPMWHLSALAARHVKVVLSGQGADEALGGYRRYRFELLRGWLKPSMAAATTLCRGLGVRSDALLRAAASVSEPDDVRRFTQVYTVFSGEQIRRLIGCDDERSQERVRYTFDLLGCRSQPHSVERMMSVDLRMNLADDLLLYTDKITMSHSIECRVPLLDIDLVRFVESLPYGYRVGPFGGKLIHKRFAGTVLPRSITARKKKGFRSPYRQWLGPKSGIPEMLADPRSNLCTYVDPAAIRTVLAEQEQGFDRERQIFLLLNLYFWFAGRN